MASTSPTGAAASPATVDTSPAAHEKDCDRLPVTDAATDGDNDGDTDELAVKLADCVDVWLELTLREEDRVDNAVLLPVLVADSDRLPVTDAATDGDTDELAVKLAIVEKDCDGLPVTAATDVDDDDVPLDDAVKELLAVALDANEALADGLAVALAATDADDDIAPLDDAVTEPLVVALITTDGLADGLADALTDGLGDTEAATDGLTDG